MGTREDVKALLSLVAKHAWAEFAKSDTGQRLKKQGLDALLGTRSSTSGFYPELLEQLIPQLGGPLAEAVLTYAASSPIERADARSALVSIIVDNFTSSVDMNRAITALLLVDEIRSAEIERRLRTLERAR
ncbi:MAG: hypothetical protein UZ21_OP11001000661 [Microgenomates bacterium OLB22]|nr:MAG: hypothetical protein UZ21_OP11001000661 [Microgenomates bacterium OLB22]